MADAGALTVGGVELALTTDSYVVRPLRFPGGSIGELAVNGTVNDLAVSGARPLALTLSLVLEEGLAADELRAEVDAIARAAHAPPACSRSPATRRSSSAATPTACTSARPGSARATSARRLSPAALRARRPDPAVRLDRRARHRDHAGAQRVRARRRDRVRHALAVAGGRRAAGRRRPVAALHARRDARRRRVGAERARAELVGGDDRARGDVPVEPAVAGAAEILGIDPMYVANEGKLVAFVAPEAADEALAALRERARLRAGRRDRRGADGAARDGAGADELWRQAGDGPAGRRSAAADLLRARGDGMASTAYAEQQEDRGGHRARPVDDDRTQLRGRLGGDDLGHEPEPRGHHPAGDPGHAEGGRPQPGRRLRGRPGLRPGVVRRRAGQARSVRALHRGVARQRGDQRRGALDRLCRESRRTASRSR